MGKGNGGNGGKKGFRDSLFDNPFGGIFDFNGDGKEDFGEQWLGYKVFDDISKRRGKQGGDSFDDDFFDSDDETDYLWRLTCDDGSEYGVDPEDYETEEDYEEALNEAKYGWRKTCEDMSETGIDPED